MLKEENGVFIVINSYGLISYFNTYEEAANYYKESLENVFIDS